MTNRQTLCSSTTRLHKRIFMMYPLLTQTGRFFLSAIHSVVLFMLVLFLAQASAQAQTYEAGGCYDIEFCTHQWQPISKWQANYRPWMYLSFRVEGMPGYFIHTKGGRCFGRINHHFARITHACRHPYPTGHIYSSMPVPANRPTTSRYGRSIPHQAIRFETISRSGKTLR